MSLLSLLKVRWFIEVKLCLSIVQLENFLTNLKSAVEILPASYFELCCHFILDRYLSRKKSLVFQSGHKYRKIRDPSVLCISTYTRILLITFIWIHVVLTKSFRLKFGQFLVCFIRDNNRYLQRKNDMSLFAFVVWRRCSDQIENLQIFVINCRFRIKKLRQGRCLSLTVKEYEFVTLRRCSCGCCQLIYHWRSKPAATLQCVDLYIFADFSKQHAVFIFRI